jgi:hypothetical protein
LITFMSHSELFRFFTGKGGNSFCSVTHVRVFGQNAYLVWSFCQGKKYEQIYFCSSNFQGLL